MREFTMEERTALVDYIISRNDVKVLACTLLAMLEVYVDGDVVKVMQGLRNLDLLDPEEMKNGGFPN